MTGGEINKVIRALRQHDIAITALHSGGIAAVMMTGRVVSITMVLPALYWLVESRVAQTDGRRSRPECAHPTRPLILSVAGMG